MPTVLMRGAVHEEFTTRSEHDAALFLQRLLEAVDREEVEEGRSVAGAYDTVVEGLPHVTHVHRLFGFWEDLRVKCSCDTYNQRLCAKLMLDLPLLPEKRAEEVTVGDLYLHYCTESGVGDAGTSFCSHCDRPKAIRTQRRVAGEPNILVLRVVRSVAGERDLRRDPVRPELRFDMPGVGSMDLWAVVYHAGSSFSSGHYHVVVRGADGRFRLFDDRTQNATGYREVSEDLVEFQRRGAVHLMVYVRVGGSADFADMLALPVHQDASGEGVAGSSAMASKKSGTSSGNLLSAPSVSTPSRPGGGLVSGTYAGPAPASESRLSTPSAPLRKKQKCAQCSAEVESVATVSALCSPAVPSPPTKVLCRRCTPKTFPGAVGAPTGDLPEPPPWPSAADVQALHARATGAASAKGDGTSPSIVLSQSMKGLSLQSPETKQQESRLDALSRQLARGLAFGSADASGVPSGGRTDATAASSAGVSASSRVAGAVSNIDEEGLRASLRELRDVGNFLRLHLAQNNVGEGILAIPTNGSMMQEGLLRDFALTWDGWIELVLNVRNRIDADGGIGDLYPFVLDTIARFKSAAEANADVVVPSNAERLEQLRHEGYEVRRGEVWGENNCLADSLLQLLVWHGIVDERVNVSPEVDRRDACAACRTHLCKLPEDRNLFPRNADETRNDEAYLEKDRHAEAVVRFFCDHFRSMDMLRQELPAAGIRLEVRTRFDAIEAARIAEAIESTTRICSSASGADGQPLRFVLFCHAGERLRSSDGYHFDPLMMETVGPPVEVVEDDS